MRKEFEKSIKKAKQLIYKMADPDHNLIHIKSVVDFAIEISKQYPEVDSDLIEVAAWWHDVGRLYDDGSHEKTSAEMAKKSLEDLNVESKISSKVYLAIIFHRWSMKPKTLEGEIIRDADKLDFISIPRWESCLKRKDFKDLRTKADLLPRLRDEILHLQISRKIFDREIAKFENFIKNIKNRNFFNASAARTLPALAGG